MQENKRHEKEKMIEKNRAADAAQVNVCCY